MTRADGEDYGAKDYQYTTNGNIAAKDGRYYSYAARSTPKHGVTSIEGGQSFTYDANGNMTAHTDASGERQYVYDGENRLTGVTKGATPLAQYAYDDAGERVKKIAGTVTTRYVFPLYEETSAQRTQYVLFDGQRVAKVQGGLVTYYHPDHLGSAHIQTNAAGATTGTAARFLPFGEFVSSAQSGPQFTGQYYDTESGLYYYGARYYNPSVGRFISPDWIVQSPTHSQSLNRYSYVWNNPVNYVDPTGNSAVDDFEDNPSAYDHFGSRVVVYQNDNQSSNYNDLFLDDPRSIVPYDPPLEESYLGLQYVNDGIDLISIINDPGLSVGQKLLFSPFIIGPLSAKFVKESAKRLNFLKETEVIQRAMSKGELKATQKTGLLRGGREGTHFVSDSVNNSALRAQQRLGLPVKPDFKVTMEIPAGQFSLPSRVNPFEVQPGRILPGGGMEREAMGKIPVKILDIKEY